MSLLVSSFILWFSFSWFSFLPVPVPVPCHLRGFPARGLLFLHNINWGQVAASSNYCLFQVVWLCEMENQELYRVASTFGFKCIPWISHMIIFMKYFKTDLSLKYFEVLSSLFSSLVFLVAQWCPTLCDPMDCSPPGSSVRGDSPGKNTGVGCPPPGDLPNLGIEPRSPSLQVDSLLSEPPGKPYEKCTLCLMEELTCKQAHIVTGAKLEFCTGT